MYNCEEHKLGNFDGFREAALHFKEFGCYTRAPRNTHPNSTYMKFWREEQRRCVEGLDLGYEKIPGYMYHYLNYSPIMKSERAGGIEIDQGKTRAERVEGFPDVWDGDYDYYWYLEEAEQHGAHATVLKARGMGYSFKGSSMLTRNYFHFKGSKSYAMASEKEFLTNDGLLSKAWNIMDFIDENTEFRKGRLVDTQMRRQSGYEQNLNGVWVKKGYKSEIIGVTLKNDPGKGRGKRGKLILFEESGSFPGLLKTWQVARPSVEDGDMTFGLMISFGTGGEEGANFESAEEMFYNPRGYNIHPCKNIWDKGRENTECGFFVPAYRNRQGCMDDKGNSNKEKALEQINKDRDIVREHTGSPMAVARAKAELPLTPQEACLKTGGTLFPVIYLKERLANVQANPAKYIDASWIGRLAPNDAGVLDWHYDDSIKIIRDFPIKDNKNLYGGIEIYEQPYKDNPEFGIYIAGTDPYDDDESSTTSLGSTFIMNTLTERIVAEYTGRPPTADQYYENVRRLLKYYNAVCNYEQNLKGMYGYFRNHNSLHLLADTPQILKDQGLTKGLGAGNKSKGTPATQNINKWGRDLAKTWLLSPSPGNEEINNLYTIRSVGLLKELIYWNPDGNFDRVSALGMLAILKEDRALINVEPEKKRNDHSTDKFWDRSFGKTKNSNPFNIKL